MAQPPITPYMPAPAGSPVPQPPPVYGPGAPPPSAVKPPKTPKDFVLYHDNVVPLWSQWDVPSALAALDQHSLGQFYQSSLLADAMGIDDAFDAVVQTRILGLISRPFEIRKSTRGHGSLAKKALRVIKDRWSEMFPDDVLSSLMHSYLLMGFAPAQLIWRYDGQYWVPQPQTWHTGTIYFDVPTRHYVANTMEGPVYLAPGDGRWILLTPFGSYRGWMHGAVRAVVVPFLARQYALRDWARYNEVHGLPIKKAKVPAGAEGDDKQTFLAGIANMGNESTVLLPQGIGDKDMSASYDLELLEAKADTYAAFKDLVSKCEERMAIRLLGQNLTTQIDAGSFAAANVHDRVRLDYVRFDAKALGALRQQVLRAFCQFNFGDPDVAPEIEWSVTPPEDSVQRATSLNQLSSALVSFRDVGAPIDIRRLLEKADLPLVPEAESVTPTPAPEPKLAAGSTVAPETNNEAIGEAFDELRAELDDMRVDLERQRHLQQEQANRSQRGIVRTDRQQKAIAKQLKLIGSQLAKERAWTKDEVKKLVVSIARIREQHNSHHVATSRNVEEVIDLNKSLMSRLAVQIEKKA